MIRPLHLVLTVNTAWNILNFRRPLVEAMLAEGHRVTVLAPADGAETQLEALGCGFVTLEMDRTGLNPVRDLALALRLRRCFRALAPDVVLGFTIKNNLFGAFAARSLDVPFVPNVTGLGTAFLSGGLLSAVARALYRAAFAGLPVVFFQNPDDRDMFVEHGLVAREQARVLPGSGVDLDWFMPAPMPPADAEIGFLMIARLLRDKGIFEFVEAARILRERGLRARFAVLGAVGSENRTAVDAAQLNAWCDEGVIEYLGTVDDVRPQIARAHCVVLPSYREGAPRTLIEAAAMARAAIASNVAGCTTVVENGVTGLLCAARSAEALADAMSRFADLNPDERSRMGQAARARMEGEFSVALVVDRYREAIRELVCGSSLATSQNVVRKAVWD